MHINTRRILIRLTLTLTLLNCSSYDFSRRSVQQGNLLPNTLIARLKIGMSKEDINTLLGTSLTSSFINNDRWDYVYTSRRGNSANEIKTISLFFKDQRLIQLIQKP